MIFLTHEQSFTKEREKSKANAHRVKTPEVCKKRWRYLGLGVVKASRISKPFNDNLEIVYAEKNS